jgi:peptide-methionine (R)-S-oxide reductase
MKLFIITALILSAVAFKGCDQTGSPFGASKSKSTLPDTLKKVTHTDAEWRQLLTTDQYAVLREKGTERAFTGAYWDNHASGVYLCAACKLPLFSSDTKFESGTGWPSFWQPIQPYSIGDLSDDSHGMKRTEVICNRCGGHLGHIFEDGPKPTGMRYCINSVSLEFKAK